MKQTTKNPTLYGVFSYRCHSYIFFIRENEILGWQLLAVSY